MFEHDISLELANRQMWKNKRIADGNAQQADVYYNNYIAWKNSALQWKARAEELEKQLAAEKLYGAVESAKGQAFSVVAKTFLKELAPDSLWRKIVGKFMDGAEKAKYQQLFQSAYMEAAKERQIPNAAEHIRV